MLSSVRSQVDVIPPVIRTVARLAAVAWAAYSVITRSGVFAWLIAMPVLSTASMPVLAVMTVAICAVVVVGPLALVYYVLGALKRR